MKKIRKTIAGIAAGAMAFLMLCVFAAVPVFGMTPIDPYGAVPFFSLYPAGGKSSLAVKSLDVTWQIDSLPPDWDYRDATQYASFLEYQPRVRAIYEFENPTDQPVKQGLYLPATLPPEYAEWRNVNVASRILEQYSITLDGKTIEPTVRYAYLSEAQNRYEHIVYENDNTMQELLAEMVENLGGKQISANTPVTVHSYIPGNEVRESGGSEMLNCRVQVEEDGPLVFIPGMWSYEVKTNASNNSSYVELGGYVSYGDVVDVCVIGEGEVEIGEWKVGRIRGDDDMRLQGTTQTTLGKLAMQEYDAATGVSREDWYSAVLAMLQDQRIQGSNVISDVNITDVGWNVRELLQPILYYEIEIAPHATVQNAVELLAYPWQLPSENGRGTLGTWTFVPPVQGAFASVRQINLHIHTALYMSEVSYYYTHEIEDYRQDEQGYSMSVSPDVPIVRFTLSSKSNYTTLSMILNEILGYLSIALMMLVFAGVPGGTITLIILLCERRASGKRKGKSTSPTDQATEQETEKGAQS